APLRRPACVLPSVPTRRSSDLESARRWGKMTAAQMICHLNDSFKAVIGERSASSVKNILGPNLIKWVALYLPIRWPHGVPTRPEDRKSTRLNSSHQIISYAVFC